MSEIRSLSIAEHAKEAARIAAETLEPGVNPHPVDHPDHLPWHNAYCRWLLAYSAPEGVEGGA